MDLIEFDVLLCAKSSTSVTEQEYACLAIAIGGRCGSQFRTSAENSPLRPASSY
jgi:hypothetical protein